MDAMLAAASYSRMGFSIYFTVRARRVRVPGGSKFHLEPGTIGIRGIVYKVSDRDCGKRSHRNRCGTTGEASMERREDRNDSGGDT